jgi:MFS family permease
MTSRRGIFTYENGLLLLLGLSWGVAFFDRTAASVLIPYIAPDLQLTNTQVGFVSSSLAIAWALGAYLIARWSDAVGSRKPFLVAFLLIFSACSFLSGLANSFGSLVAARFIMGAVEGPFLPVCLAIMLLASSDNRRGINAGIMQNFFAALMGQTVAPLVLVPLAEAYGWRAAFYIAGVPGLICAVAVMLWVREPPKVAPAAVDTTDASTPARMPLRQMIRVRNIALCSAISVFMVGWMILGWAFLPKFFTDVRGLPGLTMGNLMSVLGIASAVSGFLAPAISDRIGRKPIMITFCLAGIITPLACLYFEGSTLALGVLMFVGWTATGAFPLFMGVIPGETISRKYAATAMGLVVCAGEVVGGFGIVSLGGKLADMSSLTTPVLMMVVCAAIGGVLCFFLLETAPAKVRALAAQRVEVAKAA